MQAGKRLASEPLDEQSDEQLAAALEERFAAVRRWRQIYRDDFIPFAHGVRRLAIYYNDVVRHPCEFVGLLRGEPLLAVRRNELIAALGAPEFDLELADIIGMTGLRKSENGV